MFTIEDSIGEEPDPIAEDEHPYFLTEIEIEFDMAMTIQKVIDIGVGAHILLCEAHQVLLILTHIGRFHAIDPLHPAVLRPSQAQLHAPPRMNKVEQTLAEAVVEDAPKQLELDRRVAKSITMGKEKDLVANLRGKRLTMENDATLLLQIAVSPYIVVAREEMHLHTKVGQFRELAEEASATLWHDILVFVPKVEHIAQEIDCARLVLDTIEETDDAPLLCAAVRDGPRPKMGIGKEIDVLHRKRLLGVDTKDQGNAPPTIRRCKRLAHQAKPSSTLASSLIML